MLILGLDSTAVSASAAVAEIDDGGLRTYSVFSVKNKMTHSENLLPMVDDVLKTYGADIGDIGLMAVNAGPGSFTGVRIGVSTVKGLSFARDIPCAPVSTLESLAMNLRGADGTVAALMDARRNQFYYALFRNGVRLTDDRADGTETIAGMLEGRVWLCGDGAALFHEKAGLSSFLRSDADLRLAPYPARDQNALSVALCGYEMWKAGKTVSGKTLRPVYLRMPQAERERMEKLSEKQKGE